MSNPEAPKDDPTQVEQTVQSEPTMQAEPTEQLDTSETTRAIEVDDKTAGAVDDSPIRFDEQQPAEAGSDRSAAEQAAPEQATWPPAVPDRPSGPHAPAIVLGLVCIAVAAIVLAQELGSLSVDWGDVGPLGIVGAGAVLVLFGLVGLLTSRRRAGS